MKLQCLQCHTLLCSTASLSHKLLPSKSAFKACSDGLSDHHQYTDRLLKSFDLLQKPLMVAFMEIHNTHTLATTNNPSTVPVFLSEATATAPSFSFSLSPSWYLALRNQPRSYPPHQTLKLFKKSFRLGLSPVRRCIIFFGRVLVGSLAVVCVSVEWVVGLRLVGMVIFLGAEDGGLFQEGGRGEGWDGEGNDSFLLCYFCSVGLLLVSECLQRFPPPLGLVQTELAE